MNPIKSQIAANRERFEKEFTIFHPGDSGFNGGDPQEPVYELNTGDPHDIKYFIKTSQTSAFQTAIVAVEGLRIKPNIMGYLSDKAKGSNKTISKVVELLKGGIDN